MLKGGTCAVLLSSYRFLDGMGVMVGGRWSDSLRRERTLRDGGQISRQNHNKKFWTALHPPGRLSKPPSSQKFSFILTCVDDIWHM